MPRARKALISKLSPFLLSKMQQQSHHVPFMDGDGDWQARSLNQHTFQADILPVSAILSSVFFFSLDQTIVADIIPDIVDHFGAVQKLPWVSVTLLLAAAGTINFWYGYPQPRSFSSDLITYKGENVWLVRS